MIVTVKRNLNIRKRPDATSERIGMILAGKQIEVQNTVVGDDIEGNSVWYVDKSNNFFWSGGIEGTVITAITPSVVVAPVIPTSPPGIDQIFVNYSKRVLSDNPLMLAMQQNEVEQKKITVAVLDSGIYSDHPDFKGAFSSALPPINFSLTPPEKDVRGHGTHVAGLIGSRSDDNVGIIGVASNCVLWNVKVNDDEGASNGDALIKGLEEVIRKKPSIVNLSLSITFDEYEKVKDLLKDISKFAVIVGAAGNNKKLLHEVDVLYPAESDFVIAVGTVNDAFLGDNPNPVFNPRVDFILPMLSLWSCATKEKGFYTEDFGSSMATALVSGMLATLIKNTDHPSPATIRNLLNSISKPYSRSTDLKRLTLIRPK